MGNDDEIGRQLQTRTILEKIRIEEKCRIDDTREKEIHKATDKRVRTRNFFYKNIQLVGSEPMAKTIEYFLSDYIVH